MKDLFLTKLPAKDSEFEKTSEMGAIFLPADSTLWVKQIITNFLQQFPYLQNEQVGITWNKKDDDRGYAVGHINILNGSVPIIINEFRLSPLDIFMVNGESMPLNDYFISKIYQKPEAFKGLETGRRRLGHSTLFGTNNSLQFSPTQEYSGSNNNATVRDAVKVASVIDRLSYVNSDDAMEVIAELRDPEVRLAYTQNGHLDLFTKIASKAKRSSQATILEDFLRNVEIDRQYVYSDEFGNSFAKQANSKVNKTWTVAIDTLDKADLDPIKANDKIATIKTENLEKTAKFKPNMLKVGQRGVVAIKNQKVSNFDNFEVIKVASVEANPEVYVAKAGNSNILIEKTGNYAIGGEKTKSTLDFEELRGTEPKIGDFGVFITKEASTLPFEVTSTLKMSGPGKYEVVGLQGLNKVAYYPINVASKGFEAHEREKNAHYVPKNAKFIKLGKKDTKLAALKDFEAQIKVEGLNGFNKVAFYVTNNQETTWLANEKAYVINQDDLVFVAHEELEKVANFHKTHEVYKDEYGLYSLRGEEFAKYAQTHPTRNLNKIDASWAAIHCGATEKDVLKIASMKPKDTIVLEGEMSVPTSLETIEKRLVSKYAEFSDKKLSLSKNLVKLAAHFRDKTSVDAILSLNMLRKSNIQEYLAMLPTFQYVLGELAKLLLAARMGMDQTDPDTVKAALDGLSDVVIQLERLQAAATEIR